MPQPHGGKLINRTHNTTQTNNDLPTLKINTNLAEDIINIATGVFSPLQGFLTYNDYQNVLTHKRLQNDTPWTIPIVLDADKQQLNNLKEGDTINLTNQETGLNAHLTIEEIYTYDKKTLAQHIYTTIDANHPGIQNINNMHNHLLGGKITLNTLYKNPRR